MADNESNFIDIGAVTDFANATRRSREPHEPHPLTGVHLTRQDVRSVSPEYQPR